MVPQWTTTYLTDLGKDKSCALYKTCHEFYFQGCLILGFLIIGFINSTEGCNVISLLTYHDCYVLSQLTLLLSLIGANLYVFLSMLIMQITILISDYQKFNATRITTITMHGLWLGTTQILLTALMTCVSRTTLKMNKRSQPVLATISSKKSQKFQGYLNFFKMLGASALAANFYWIICIEAHFFNGVKRLAVNFSQHVSKPKLKWYINFP